MKRIAIANYLDNRVDEHPCLLSAALDTQTYTDTVVDLDGVDDNGKFFWSNVVGMKGMFGLFTRN